MCSVDEDAVLLFVRNRVPSAWTLDLLLLLYRGHASAWTCDVLVRELRATSIVVMQSLGELMDAGVIAEADDGRYVYCPHTPELAALIDDLAALYVQKPVTVLKTIFAPSGKVS